MLRDTIVRHYDHDPHFRWRGENVTRIENLSDIVFAIAFGMLVSASSPPTNYNELLGHLWQIVPVIAGFSILVMIWNSHFVFFRRYNIADRWIIFLNAILLLIVLFIAYPLRFIFDGLFGYVLGAVLGDWSRMIETGMGFAQSGNIVGIFAIGYACVFLVTAGMYGHALRKKDALELNANEIALTRRSVWHLIVSLSLCILVAITALMTSIGPYAACILSLSALTGRILRRKFPVSETTEDQVSVETSSHDWSI